MTVTLIGMIVVGACLLVLVFGTRLQMLAIVLACTLLNGAAALIMPTLGHVSVQPALVATLFLALQCALPSQNGTSAVAIALADNAWLALFAVYGAIGAFTLPFVFEGSIALVPLRPSNNPLGLTVHPLRFSPQNITTAGYMLLTLCAAVCAHVAVQRAGAAARLARWGCRIGLAHAAIGLGAAGARGTPVESAFAFFRNGSYMQLDQTFAGVVRLTGISPEPSLYASFGLAWFFFATELWLGDVERRLAGLTALVLGLTLLASTSTTAYVGLGAYGFVLIGRQALRARTISAPRLLLLASFLLTLVAGAMALILGSEDAARALGRIVRLTTAEKLDSGSGEARLLWAGQGAQAFLHSFGLGVGAGSFRSSSVLTAVLGSCGMIGITALLLHIRRLFVAGTALGGTDGHVASAAAWTALLVLVPASVSAPSPDPGLVWGLLAGSALGLHRAVFEAGRAKARQTASVPVGIGAEDHRRHAYAHG